MGYRGDVLPCESLAQVAHRSCGRPCIPGNVQGQVERGLEQPGIVEDLVHGGGVDLGGL